jgi:hypothetical protein
MASARVIALAQQSIYFHLKLLDQLKSTPTTFDIGFSNCHFGNLFKFDIKEGSNHH